VTVKIDENEPNVFPTVDATVVNVRTGAPEIDVTLITRIDGKPVRVRVKLDRVKTQVLAAQLTDALQN
jgi:hypothetical protein